MVQSNYGGSAPLTWVGRVPVYLATVFAAAQAAGMVITALAMGVGAGGFLAGLAFNWNEAAAGGRVWQFLTYPLVTGPSLWTLIQLVMFAMFGGEVEKYIGRRGFLWLVVALVLAGPLLMGIVALFGEARTLAGGSEVNFAVFIACVLLYPRAEIFFGIQARWIALALLAIASLQALAGRDFLGLILVWWVCGAAFLFLRWEGVAAAAGPVLRPARRKVEARPPRRVVRPPSPAANPRADLHESIDPILEKISRTGIASLTKDERARLERARARLLENESPGHR